MSTSSKKITLKSSDEETFVVDEVVARESQLIKNIIEYGYDCMDRAIPIPNVTSKTLAKVIEYCKKHAEVSKTEGNNTAAVCQELKAWDASFIKVDQSTLFYLTLAANLLNIKGLFELTCQTFADMMKGSRTLEEIKKFFDLENKFTSKKELGLFLLGS